MDSFNDLFDENGEPTEKLRQKLAYAACILSGAASGLIAGAKFPAPAPAPYKALGAAALAVAGLGGAILSCPYITTTLKNRFTRNESLTDNEIVAALQAMQIITGVQNKSDAAYLLILARQSIAAGGLNKVDPKACMPPQVAPSMLLAQKS